MAFKEQVAQDVESVFINIDEFGVPMYIDGEVYDVVVDSDLSNERERLYTVGRAGTNPIGVYQSTIIIFIREKDLGYVPEEGRHVYFGDSEENSYPYVVSKVSSAAGILEITIEGNKA